MVKDLIKGLTFKGFRLEAVSLRLKILNQRTFLPTMICNAGYSSMQGDIQFLWHFPTIVDDF